MGSSLVLSWNIRLFVIELDYDYRYLLKVCSELSDICFMIWLRYHSMLALHDRPVLAMVNILALELYQLFQYLYVCSSMMSVHPEGGGSVRDTWCLYYTMSTITSDTLVSRAEPPPSGWTDIILEQIYEYWSS